jgi:hypothetical protein
MHLLMSTRLINQNSSEQEMFKYFAFFVFISWLWLLYEFHRAPTIDKDGHIKKK